MPRGGLAIGHSSDADGRVRIELRLTGAKGSALGRAMKVRRTAEMQGFLTRLWSFAERPKIPLHVPGHSPRQPAIAGRRDPLHVGASVAHEQSSAGTLAAFVDIVGGGKGILSCTHVLAYRYRGKACKGDFVQQPGIPDVCSGTNRIGRLTEYFRPFIAGREDNLDAAVARLDDDVKCQFNVIPSLPCIDSALWGAAIGAPLLDPPPLTRVCRIGRTSGFGVGEVTTVDMDNFRIDVGARNPITFAGVHEVRWLDGQPETQPGDSGALVMTQDGLRPIGIHFCAIPLEDGAVASYVISWKRIAKELPISLS
jgi:hypothetical protein